MIIAGQGLVDPASIKTAIINGQERLVFTLRDNGNRFYITVAGFEQLRLLAGIKDAGVNARIMVLGAAHTFRGERCGQHHVAIVPQILLPLDGLNGLEQTLLAEIKRQWLDRDPERFHHS